MPYSAGTAFLEIVPSFLNVESLLAKGARDIAKSLDKSLGAQLGKSMQNAAKSAERDTERAADQLGKTFSDTAVKRINAALANIPAGDRILSGLRKELTALSQVDLGKGFDEKDFIARVEKAYEALRKAQQDATGKNAVSRTTNAGNAAQELGAVKDIVDAARKRGFVAGDAFSDAYQSRLKAMDKALPDLKVTANSSQEERAVAALKARIQDAMKLSIGDVATKDNNPLNLKIGAKIDGTALKREMAHLEGLLDQFTERFNSAELVLPLDKARQHAGQFFTDVQTQEEKANEKTAADYLKTWDDALAEQAKRDAKARADLNNQHGQAIAEDFKRQKKAQDDFNAQYDAAIAEDYKRQKKQRDDFLRDWDKALADARAHQQKAAAAATAAAEQAFQKTTGGQAASQVSSAADRIVDLPVHLQANDLDREMAGIRARLKAMGDVKIGVDIDSESFANDVEKEFARLSTIAKDKKVDIEVRVDAAAAATELGAVLVLLNRIDHDKATVNVDANSATASFEGLAQALTLNLGRLGGLIALGASLGSALVPAAAAAASTIGAIGTSALAAASGVGVLALAFSGIGGAVKALSQYQLSQQKSNVSLAKSANQVESANQQIQSAEMALANTRRNNGEAAVKAARAVTDALQEQKNTVREVAATNLEATQAIVKAQQDLTDANQQEKDARDALNDSYVQAERDLQALNSQVRGNALDQRQAVLDIKKAKEDLDKALANPRATADEREQAQITYQQQLLQLDDLKSKGAQLSDDQAKQFQQGIQQNDKVVAAKKALQQANNQQKDAQNALAKAQRDQQDKLITGQQKLQAAQRKVDDARTAAASQQKDAAFAEFTATQSLISARRALANATDSATTAGGAQLQNLQQAMAQLSPTAQKFARYIFGLQDAFFALRKAADPVLAAIQKALEGLVGKTSKDAETKLKPVFNFVHDVAVGLGGLIGRFADLLKGPEFTKFFGYIAKTAVPQMQVLYQGFQDITVGIVNLFLAFTPMTKGVSKGFLGMTASFRKWSEGLSTNKGFQNFLAYMKKSGPQVAKLFVVIAKAVGNLIIAAAPVGTVVVDLFTRFFNIINKIPEKTLKALIAGIAAGATALGLIAIAAGTAALELPGLIALLVGGLIVAISVLAGNTKNLGKIFATVWADLKIGAKVAFDFVKAVIASLKPAFEDTVKALKNAYENGIKPAFDDIVALGTSLYNGLKPSFGNIVNLVKNLWGFIIYLYRNVTIPVFNGIIAVAKVLLQVLKPVFETIGAVIGALATIIFWLLDKIVFPVVSGIVHLLVNVLGPTFKFLWTFILKPILLAIGIAFQIAAALIKVAIGVILIVLKALAILFSDVYHKWIKPVWDLLLNNVFKPLGQAIDKYIGPYWKKALDALAKRWDDFKKQIGFVVKIIVHYALNEGLLKGYNWLANKFNITPKNVQIPEPTGDWYTKASPGQVAGHATGGAVRGPGTGTSDSIVARLSDGEHVLTAEEVRKAGGHRAVYALRDAILAGWRMPGFASGGPVTNDGSSSNLGIGGWLSGVAKSIGHGAENLFGNIEDFLKDPIGNLKRIFEGMLGKIGVKSGNVDSLLAAPKNLLTGVLNKVGSIVGLGNNAATPISGAVASTLGNLIGKVGWLWQESVLRSAFGNNIIFTSTTGGSHAKNSWHYRGRAVDSIGSGKVSMMEIFNWIKSHYGGTSKELIYSPAVTGIKNGKPVNIRDFYGSSVYSQHFNHVHWAYDNGGLIPDTRRMPGGVMSVFHGNRTPDKVLTDTQWGSMARLANVAQASMSGGDTHNWNFRNATLDYDELTRWSARRDALARVNRPNY